MAAFEQEGAAGPKQPLPPIPDGAVMVTVKIARFNPDEPDAFAETGGWQSFRVPCLPSDRLLNLLIYICLLYTSVLATYKTPIVGLMEFGLVAAVLFHALNGIRIILIDFWREGPRYQRLMLWIIGVVYLLLMVPVAVVLGVHMWEHFR